MFQEGEIVFINDLYQLTGGEGNKYVLFMAVVISENMLFNEYMITCP